MKLRLRCTKWISKSMNQDHSKTLSQWIIINIWLLEEHNES